jgi:hypothetical protein
MRKLQFSAVLVFIMCSALPLAAADRWIHVRVIDQGQKGEAVSVNLPLALAEQILPTINTGDLKNGKVSIHGQINGVDVQRILEAVHSTGNNEFVSVKSKDENVRVAKDGNLLLIRVHESKGSGKDVEVRVPMEVADALFSSGNGQLDLLAAIRALQGMKGDTDLVSVRDENSNVHIWVDSKNDTD